MEKAMHILRAGAVTAVVMLAGSARAGTIALWDFNSPIPDSNVSTGTTTPAIGSGTASLVGGTTATFASGDASGGSSDPATGDDSGWQTTNYPAQGTAQKTAGVQFLVSTQGYQSILVAWDQRHSNTSNRFVQFQYTTDGSTWIDLGSLYVGDAGDTWFNNRSADLSGIPAVNDNPYFGFRIVSAFDPQSDQYVASDPNRAYASTGTWRFDMVRVTGVLIPEPASWAILALAGLCGAVRRRSA